jgi:hypothetical protein
MNQPKREAPEMAKVKAEPGRPYGGGDYAYVRAGREGHYWQAANGIVVRVAAPENARLRSWKGDAREVQVEGLFTVLGGVGGR